MSIQKGENIDLELIKNCLKRFICEHAKDPYLSNIPLTEASIKGAMEKEGKGLWFLGKWSIQGTAPNYKAIWSTEVAPNETILVTVELKKIDHDFVVADWHLKQILF